MRCTVSSAFLAAVLAVNVICLAGGVKIQPAGSAGVGGRPSCPLGRNGLRYQGPTSPLTGAIDCRHPGQAGVKAGSGPAGGAGSKSVGGSKTGGVVAGKKSKTGGSPAVGRGSETVGGDSKTGGGAKIGLDSTAGGNHKTVGSSVPDHGYKNGSRMIGGVNKGKDFKTTTGPPVHKNKNGTDAKVRAHDGVTPPSLSGTDEYWIRNWQSSLNPALRNAGNQANQDQPLTDAARAKLQSIASNPSLPGSERLAAQKILDRDYAFQTNAQSPSNDPSNGGTNNGVGTIYAGGVGAGGPDVTTGGAVMPGGGVVMAGGAVVPGGGVVMAGSAVPPTSDAAPAGGNVAGCGSASAGNTSPAPDPTVAGSEEDVTPPVPQATRFLKVRNTFGEDATVYVKYFTEDETHQWSWRPSDPDTAGEAVRFQVPAGQTVSLVHRGRRINASRVRIWATLDSGRELNAFKHEDLVLVPEEDNDGNPSYRSAHRQTYVFSLK